MPVLSKKGIIKSLWVDLLCLAFFVWESQRASTGNSVSCSLVNSTRSSFHYMSPVYQELRDLNLISSTISLLSWQRLSFGYSQSTLGTNFTHFFRIFSSSLIIVCTVPKLTSNCALIICIDTQRSLSMKFFIWRIYSGVLTSVLLPHLSPSLSDSLHSFNL